MGLSSPSASLQMTQNCWYTWGNIPHTDESCQAWGVGLCGPHDFQHGQEQDPSLKSGQSFEDLFKPKQSYDSVIINSGADWVWIGTCTYHKIQMLCKIGQIWADHWLERKLRKKLNNTIFSLFFHLQNSVVFFLKWLAF